MSSVLVTGATGNVGKEVAQALLRGGFRVIAADRSEGRAAQLFDSDAVPAHLQAPSETSTIQDAPRGRLDLLLYSTNATRSE